MWIDNLKYGVCVGVVALMSWTREFWTNRREPSLSASDRPPTWQRRHSLRGRTQSIGPGRTTHSEPVGEDNRTHCEVRCKSIRCTLVRHLLLIRYRLHWRSSSEDSGIILLRIIQSMIILYTLFKIYEVREVVNQDIARGANNWPSVNLHITVHFDFYSTL